jgi:hypothetical protein
MRNDTKLLREYVRTILVEESDGGGGSDSGTSWIGFGAGTSAGSSTGVKGMAATLLHPLKVFIGKSKELGSSIKNLGKVSASAIASIATGGMYQPNYEELDNAYKSEMSQLQQQNAPLYAETRKILDRAGVTTAAFLYNPALYITARHPKEAFRVALATAGVDWVAGALGLSLSAGAGLGASFLAYSAGKKVTKKDMLAIKGLISKHKNKLVEKAKEATSKIGENYRQTTDAFFQDIQDKASKLQAIKSIEEFPLAQKEKEKLKKEFQSNPRSSEEKFVKTTKQAIAKTMIQDLIKHRNDALGNAEDAKKSELYERYTSEIANIARIFTVSETGQ